MRRCLVPCMLALLLSACGGGTVVVGADGFFLNVVGFSKGFTFGPSTSGQPLIAAIHPGDSIEFDAGTTALWTISVNGGAAVPAGTTFVVGGLTITTTVLGSRLAISTSVAPGALVLPVTLALTAVAQADTRRAATVTLQVR